MEAKKPWISVTAKLMGGLTVLAIGWAYLYVVVPDARAILLVIGAICGFPIGVYFYWKLIEKFSAPISYEPPVDPVTGKQYMYVVRCEKCGKLSEEPISKVKPTTPCSKCGTEYHIVDRNIVGKWM